MSDFRTWHEDYSVDECAIDYVIDMKSMLIDEIYNQNKRKSNRENIIYDDILERIREFIEDYGQGDYSDRLSSLTNQKTAMCFVIAAYVHRNSSTLKDFNRDTIEDIENEFKIEGINGLLNLCSQWNT